MSMSALFNTRVAARPATSNRTIAVRATPGEECAILAQLKVFVGQLETLLSV